MASFGWPVSGGSLSAPVLYATASSAPTGTLSGTFNDIVFNTATIDSANGYNTTTGIYTVPSTGVYFVHAFIRISHTSTAANQILALRFLRSGTDLPGSTFTTPIMASGITAGITISHSTLMNCTSASHTIRAQSYTEGGSPAYVSGSIYHGFVIYKVRDI